MKAKFLAKIRPTDESVAGGDCLTSRELETSRTFWIKAAQNSLDARVKAHELKMLSPFTDDEGIFRAGERIDNALVSYETWHTKIIEIPD